MIMQIPLDDILSDRRLAYRDDLAHWAGTVALRDSILRCGILRPVTLARTPAGLLLVAGFRRVDLLRELGETHVPARLEDAQEDLGQLFLRAVEEHAGQPTTLRERLRAIRVADQLGWSTVEIARRLMPSLELGPQPHLVQQYLQLGALPEALLDFFVAKGFSLRRCLPFLALDRAAGDLLARAALKWHLGGRQLEEIATWLLEISRRENVPLAQVMAELDLVEARPAGGQGAEKHDAGQLLQRIVRRRLPETSRRREELDQLVQQLSGPALRVVYDRNFASDMLEIVLRGRELHELQRALSQLQQPQTLSALQRLWERL